MTSDTIEMLKKILIGIVLVVAAFLTFVAMQPSEYHIAREVKISAPAEKIFPHVNDPKKFDVWNPWSKMDTNLKQSYEGSTAGVGAISKWEGDKVGSGQMTIVESQPSSLIRMKLEFFKPFPGVSDVNFTFKPEGKETSVTWAMSGRSNFVGKIFCVFMSQDKMVGGEFEKGLASLKATVENEGKK